MKNKFFIIFILIAVMIFATACSHEEAELTDIEYDLSENDSALKESVVLYDGAIQWMREEYKNANRTKPLPDTDDCPGEITNVITTKEDFDEAFDEFPVEINFDEQMLVLYIFAADNIFAQGGKRLRYYELTDVTQEGTKIDFGICLNKTALLIPDEQYLDTTIPTHLCLAFLMPKMQVNEFGFDIDYKTYYIEWKGDLKSNATLYDADLEWLREEYREDINSVLQTSDTFTAKIQDHVQFVTAFKKFYNDFDVEDEMIVTYFFNKDNSDANAYEYSIADIKCDEGYLDIVLNKKAKEIQSGDDVGDTGFLAIRLPKLPAYKINIAIN